MNDIIQLAQAAPVDPVTAAAASGNAITFLTALCGVLTIGCGLLVRAIISLNTAWDARLEALRLKHDAEIVKLYDAQVKLTDKVRRVVEKVMGMKPIEEDA